MKLKKTLSMLIGGICLVAATTVALAGTNHPYTCDWCGSTAGSKKVLVKTEVTSYYTHNYYVKGKRYICNAQRIKKTYENRCVRCNYNFGNDWTNSEIHPCGMYN